MWPGMPKLPKVTSLLYLYNILRNKWVMKLIFCMQIDIKVSCKLMLWFYENSKHSESFQYFKKYVRGAVDFLRADKHQSSLHVDFNALGIAVSHKLMLSLLMGMMKHSQSTQSNRIKVSLQHLKKENRDGVHFMNADEH